MSKTFAVAFVALVLALMCAVLGWSFADAASNSDARADACHTYHTFSHQKDVEAQAETDGVHCGQGSIIPAAVANGDSTITLCMEDQPCWDCSTMGNGICGPITTPVSPVVTPKPNVVTPEPTQPTTPVIVDTNGNPGNDKPVGQTEHCEKGMCEQGTEGNKGQSNNPNK